MIKRLIAVLITLHFILSVGFTVGAAEEEKSVIIGFNEKQDMKMLEENGGKIKYQYNTISAIAVTISEKELKKLEKHPNVAYIEEDVKVYVIADKLSWGVDRIDADMVWGTDGVPDIDFGGNTGAGVKVAIIDTGIDEDHPDLQGNIAGGINYVFTSPTETLPNDNWDDGHGHGTHVAGIVAAMDNDIGVIGVAPQAQLYAVKVLSDSGAGSMSDVIAGIDWAVANDMDVISMSLGISVPYRSLEEACNNAYNAGVVVVAGAGNDRSSVIYPAAYDSVIAVSATTSTDSIATYSNRGPEIELAAPGSSIYSTNKDGGYTLKSGTSMATPHVTGAVALVLNTPITETYDVNNNNRWDPVEVRQRLKDTATDLGAGGWDIYFGFGLVNAYEATSLGEKPPSDIDWNTWDDDGVISNTEISMAEWHWATNTPINDHMITNAEISLLEYQWATGSVS